MRELVIHIIENPIEFFIIIFKINSSVIVVGRVALPHSD